MFLDHPGLSPVRHLIQDAQVTEIMINGPRRAYVERGGRMEPVALDLTDATLDRLIQALLQPSGRTVSASSPYVDFRLPDGSRGNVVIPPLAVDGPAVTIRKFTRSLATVADLMKAGTLSRRMGHLLAAAVKGRANILFAGATGTGKTTTLNILSRYIPEGERIVTIEDTAELSLQQGHVVRLECRGANIEGKGAVTWPTSCATPCGCGPPGSSWARSAARRPSTCFRRLPPATRGAWPSCTPVPPWMRCRGWR